MFLRRKNIEQSSDEELVSRLKRGDHASLGGLWDRYAHLLYGVGMKYLKDPEKAKDLVVELFTLLPDLLRKHQVQRFRPWIHTVMRNQCLLYLRNEHTHGSIENAVPLRTDDEAEKEAQLHEYTLQQLEQAVERLEPGQRSCITLFYLERNSYKEVAEITGYTIEKVRSNIQNGRRNLKLILQKNGNA